MVYRFVVSVLVGALLAFIATINTGCATLGVGPKPLLSCNDEFISQSKPYLDTGFGIVGKRAGSDYVELMLRKDYQLVSFVFTVPANKDKALSGGYKIQGSCLLTDGSVAIVVTKEFEMKKPETVSL